MYTINFDSIEAYEQKQKGHGEGEYGYEELYYYQP